MYPSKVPSARPVKIRPRCHSRLNALREREGGGGGEWEREWERKRESGRGRGRGSGRERVLRGRGRERVLSYTTAYTDDLLVPKVIELEVAEDREIG